jgi:hypothetical protein
MIFLRFLALALSVIIQGGSVPSFEGGILNPKEKTQLEKANSVDRRIKVYTAATKRIDKSLREAVSKGQFETVAADLKLWTSLLSKSLEDIEANLKSKKKSRDLIKYEIQVRKTLSNLQDYRIQAPIEQQEEFDSCLAEAEAIRQKFVDILFPR